MVMKKHRTMEWALVFGLLAGMAPSVRAGFPTAFSIHTGTAFPVSPSLFKESYTQGYTFGLRGGIRPASWIDIQGVFHLHQCSFDVPGYEGTLTEISDFETNFPDGDASYSTEGSSAVMWTLGVNAKLILPSLVNKNIESYVFIGGGLFGIRKGRIESVDYEEDDIAIFENHEKTIPEKSEKVFGAECGLGVAFLLEEHSNFFIEVGPVIGFTKGDPTMVLPIRFGVEVRP
jgi:hypothetical protein